MKKIHAIIGVFFSIIIFSVPIFNQLHFKLIDHSTSIHHTKKEVIHHQCEHYTFYHVYLDTHDKPKLEEIWKNSHSKQIQKVEKQVCISPTIISNLTRGPPSFIL
jgi:hypothetical protein